MPISAAAVVGAFNGYAQIAAVNAAGRWFPPTGDYTMELVKMDFQEGGMEFTQKSTGIKTARNKLTFTWRIIEGEFAGRDVIESDYIFWLASDNKDDKARARQEKTLGRLRGVLETVTGQTMPGTDFGQGFVYLYNEAEKILANGAFPMKVNAYYNEWDKESTDKDGKKSVRKQKDVYITALEPLESPAQ